MCASLLPFLPSLSFQPLPYARPVKVRQTLSQREGFLWDGMGGASHSLLSHRFLRLVERPAAWPGGPLPWKLCGEDLRGVARILSFPSAALARRSNPVASSPAQTLGGSEGHHCSQPWALASPVSYPFPPVSHRANSRAYLPAALYEMSCPISKAWGKVGRP